MQNSFRLNTATSVDYSDCFFSIRGLTRAISSTSITADLRKVSSDKEARISSGLTSDSMDSGFIKTGGVPVLVCLVSCSVPILKPVLQRASITEPTVETGSTSSLSRGIVTELDCEKVLA